jgi:hypothetical protein
MLSEAERLRRAGQLAADELKQEAALKKRRVALTITARQRLDSFINNYKGKDGKLEALNRTIAFHADGKANFLSVESRGKATRDYALSQLQEAFEAVDPRFFGLFEDEKGVRDLVYEIRGKVRGMLKPGQVQKPGRMLLNCSVVGLTMRVATSGIWMTGACLSIIQWKKLARFLRISGSAISLGNLTENITPKATGS